MLLRREAFDFIGEEGQEADLLNPGGQFGGGANAEGIVPAQAFHCPVSHTHILAILSASSSFFTMVFDVFGGIFSIPQFR